MQQSKPKNESWKYIHLPKSVVLLTNRKNSEEGMVPSCRQEPSWAVITSPSRRRQEARGIPALFFNWIQTWTLKLHKKSNNPTKVVNKLRINLKFSKNNQINPWTKLIIHRKTLAKRYFNSRISSLEFERIVGTWKAVWWLWSLIFLIWMIVSITVLYIHI